MLQRAHREAPAISLFLRFSTVRSLLCIRIQMKEFTFGMLSGCQTFLQRWSFVSGSKESLMYPSLTIYCPFLPQPMRSLDDSQDGDKPCRDENRRIMDPSKWARGWSSFQPIQHPNESHDERSWRVWMPWLWAHSTRLVNPESEIRGGFPRMLQSQTLIFLPLPGIQQ